MLLISASKASSEAKTLSAFQVCSFLTFERGRAVGMIASFRGIPYMIIHPHCIGQAYGERGPNPQCPRSSQSRPGTYDPAKLNRQERQAAKFYDFLGDLRGLGGSRLLSDINSRKPYPNARRTLTIPFVMNILETIMNMLVIRNRAQNTDRSLCLPIFAACRITR
jgi:hypothetical protein